MYVHHVNIKKSIKGMVPTDVMCSTNEMAIYTRVKYSSMSKLQCPCKFLYQTPNQSVVCFLELKVYDFAFNHSATVQFTL